MSDPTPDFLLGWNAALQAARRSRFPKNLERQAEVHQRSPEIITLLSPDDV